MTNNNRICKGWVNDANRCCTGWGACRGSGRGEMMHFLSSMQADRHIADADILVDIAHVLMLDKQKIIDRGVTKQLLPALLEMYDEGIPEEAFDDRFEDIHAGIESFLIECCGCRDRRAAAYRQVAER